MNNRTCRRLRCRSNNEYSEEDNHIHSSSLQGSLSAKAITVRMCTGRPAGILVGCGGSRGGRRLSSTVEKTIFVLLYLKRSLRTVVMTETIATCSRRSKGRNLRTVGYNYLPLEELVELYAQTRCSTTNL